MWEMKIGWQMTDAYAGCFSWHIVVIYRNIKTGESRTVCEDTKFMGPDWTNDYVRRLRKKCKPFLTPSERA